MQHPTLQLPINRAEPLVMHIDLNSCFATIEQQANPLLSGKPVVVAAYTTGNGCILAASCEAKRFGIKTGMRVWEAKRLYPSLIVLFPDPEKYRYINELLTSLLQSYSDHVQVQSIDEMIVRFDDMPMESIMEIAKDIKKRIREEIGVWITVSIGIASNAFLAKTASNLKKHGYNTYWMDGIAEEKTYDQWFDELSATSPDYLMVETKSPIVKTHWKQIKELKKRKL